MTIPNWCAYNFDNIRIGVVYPYKSGYAIANRDYGGYPVEFPSLKEAQDSLAARNPFICRWEREDVPQETPDSIGATVCAWCAGKGITTVLKAGDPTKPVSHGLCPSCKEQLEQEVA